MSCKTSIKKYEEILKGIEEKTSLSSNFFKASKSFYDDQEKTEIQKHEISQELENLKEQLKNIELESEHIKEENQYISSLIDEINTVKNKVENCKRNVRSDSKRCLHELEEICKLFGN